MIGCGYMEELVQVLTEDGKLTGNCIDKLKAHKEGICHGISAVGLINSDGKLLLQKRLSTKKLEPSKWDYSSAGHIDLNENSEDAIIRETYEELGIVIDKKELTLIDTFLVKVKLTDEVYINHFTYLYIVKKDIDINEFKINKKEISMVKYVGKDEYNNLIKNDDTVYAMRYCDKVLDYIN